MASISGQASDVNNLPNSHKILMAGHSHAKHLGYFVNSRDNRINFAFDPAVAQILFHGVGGLRMRDLASHSHKGTPILETIAEFKPHTLVLFLGDNDLNENTSAEEVSSFLHVLASHLKNKYTSIQTVVYTQLLPRFGVAGTRHDYNRKACNVNSNLLDITKDTDFIFFRFCNFPFPYQNESRYLAIRKHFKRDGVHLTHSGNYRLYKTMRWIVIKCVKGKV